MYVCVCVCARARARSSTHFRGNIPAMKAAIVIPNSPSVYNTPGISLPAYNPRLGYGATQLLSDHYPERLGMVICINHNQVFHGVWKAIKIFLHPNTIAKMKLVRSKRKVSCLYG